MKVHRQGGRRCLARARQPPGKDGPAGWEKGHPLVFEPLVVPDFFMASRPLRVLSLVTAVRLA